MAAGGGGDEVTLQFMARLKEVRDAFKQLRAHCTDRQRPYIAKPFFYGIKFFEEQARAEDEPIEDADAPDDDDDGGEQHT